MITVSKHQSSLKESKLFERLDHYMRKLENDPSNFLERSLASKRAGGNLKIIREKAFETLLGIFERDDIFKQVTWATEDEANLIIRTNIHRTLGASMDDNMQPFEDSGILFYQDGVVTNYAELAKTYDIPYIPGRHSDAYVVSQLFFKFGEEIFQYLEGEYAFVWTVEDEIFTYSNIPFYIYRNNEEFHLTTSVVVSNFLRTLIQSFPEEEQLNYEVIDEKEPLIWIHTEHNAQPELSRTYPNTFNFHYSGIGNRLLDIDFKENLTMNEQGAIVPAVDSLPVVLEKGKLMFWNKDRWVDLYTYITVCTDEPVIYPLYSGAKYEVSITRTTLKKIEASNNWERALFNKLSFDQYRKYFKVPEVLPTYVHPAEDEKESLFVLLIRALANCPRYEDSFQQGIAILGVVFKTMMENHEDKSARRIYKVLKRLHDYIKDKQ